MSVREVRMSELRATGNFHAAEQGRRNAESELKVLDREFSNILGILGHLKEDVEDLLAPAEDVDTLETLECIEATIRKALCAARRGKMRASAALAVQEDYPLMYDMQESDTEDDDAEVVLDLTPRPRCFFCRKKAKCTPVAVKFARAELECADCEREWGNTFELDRGVADGFDRQCCNDCLFQFKEGMWSCDKHTPEFAEGREAVDAARAFDEFLAPSTPARSTFRPIAPAAPAKPGRHDDGGAAAGAGAPAAKRLKLDSDTEEEE